MARLHSIRGVAAGLGARKAGRATPRSGHAHPLQPAGGCSRAAGWCTVVSVACVGCFWRFMLGSAFPWEAAASAALICEPSPSPCAAVQRGSGSTPRPDAAHHAFSSWFRHERRAFAITSTNRGRFPFAPGSAWITGACPALATSPVAAHTMPPRARSRAAPSSGPAARSWRPIQHRRPAAPGSGNSFARPSDTRENTRSNASPAVWDRPVRARAIVKTGSAARTAGAHRPAMLPKNTARMIALAKPPACPTDPYVPEHCKKGAA